MNLFLPPYLTTLLLSWAAYTLVLAVGKLTLPLFCAKRDKAYVTHFFELLTGLVIIITAFALMKTAFNSVFILSAIMVLLFLIVKQRKLRFRYRIPGLTLKQYIIGIATLSLLYSLAYYFFYIYSDAAVFGDNQFYANVADRLLNSGMESNNVDWTREIVRPARYHYAEMWFTALFSLLFSVNTLMAYYLIYVPVFGAVVVHGAIALGTVINGMAEKKMKSSIIIFCGFLFLIIQNFSIPFLPYEYATKLSITGTWFHNIKYSVVFILLLAAAITGMEKNYRASMLFVLLLIPFYSSPVIGITAGLFTLWGYLLIKRRVKPLTIVMYAGTLVFVLAGYILFYKFQVQGAAQKFVPSVNQAAETLSQSSIRMDLMQFVLNGFVKHVILSWLLLILLIMVAKRALNRRGSDLNLRAPGNEYLKYLILFLTGAFVALAVYILLYLSVSKHDALQFLTNFSSPLLVIFIFMVLVFVMINLKERWRLPALLAITAWFIVLLCQAPAKSFNMDRREQTDLKADMSYYSEISKLVKEFPDYRFGYFRDYHNRKPTDYKPFLFVPDNRIAHLVDAYLPLGLSVFDIGDDMDPYYGSKSRFEFYRFVKRQQNRDEFTSVEESMKEFIDRYNLRFIIVEDGAGYPGFIDESALKRFVNRENGNIFILLDELKGEETVGVEY